MCLKAMLTCTSHFKVNGITQKFILFLHQDYTVFFFLSLSFFLCVCRTLLPTHFRSLGGLVCPVMTAWVRIFTALESAPTPAACYAASANPWTETIQDNVPHYLTFRHRASCVLGQAFHYSPENAFYIFNQQIYFFI